MPTRKTNKSKPTVDRFLQVNKLIITGLSVVSLGAFAQQSVTLHDAINNSLQQHPDLQPFTYMQKASRGLIEQAGVSSPITINADVEDVFGLDKIISIVAPRSESINNAKNLHLKVTTGELFEKVYKVCTQLNAGSIHKEVCYVNPGKTTLLDWEYDDIVDTNGVVGDFIFIVRGYDESDVMVVERRCRFKVQ